MDNPTRRHVASRNIASRMEPLEQRAMLSVSFDPATAELASSAARPRQPGPAIRLDLVALHELGHSLGLEHNASSSSIMYAYYNAGYNLSNLAADPAVAELAAIYAGPESGPWKDSLDASPGDGTVQITYSYIPDGTKLDSKRTSTLFATFNGLYGSTSAWQTIFAQQLGRWSAVSGGTLQFVAHSDAGLAFNYIGAVQNDANAGDIRIGAHRFDGAGKVLGHTYYPPPNGVTAAGDAHFDEAENWDGLRSAAAVFSTAPIGPTSLADAAVSGAQECLATQRDLF